MSAWRTNHWRDASGSLSRSASSPFTKPSEARGIGSTQLRIYALALNQLTTSAAGCPG